MRHYRFLPIRFYAPCLALSGLLHLAMSAHGLRDILGCCASLVAFGIEADINAQAEFDDSVENDPKRTFSCNYLWIKGSCVP